MAHHKSALKRIRQAAKKRIQNRYYKKSTRTLIKSLRSTEDKNVATELLPKVISMVDKLAKNNNIHKNKAANLVSSLTKRVNAIS